MTDVYRRLAKKLDDLPNGFPATESGVELKILQKIFTPEEAETTLQMRPMPETVEAAAERLGKPVDEMQAILDNLVKRGQIGSAKVAGKDVYMLFPFLIGIYEFQLKRMDKELSDLFEEYAPELVKTVGGFEPAMARVVPISTEIDEKLHVHRHEDIRRMIEEAKSFQLMECICRKEQALQGNPCKHTLQICLGFSNEEEAFDKYPRGEVISKEKALKVLVDAEQEGLVHLTYNIEHGQAFVCNCCPCCCGALRAVKEFNFPHMLAKSYFTASIDQESCAECGVCADERCPMDAIVEEDDGYRVLAERCIGCGACVSSCTTESIKLVRKPESEHDKPPANLMQWYMERAVSRGIEVTLD
ncbi:MAG: 4Fe-4S binding protein [Candidatus Hydrogenedentota bacterium]|nr:MAG: 4Fe-4S binding protein [Candidatus Hydrogenedentota bacterium]